MTYERLRLVDPTLLAARLFARELSDIVADSDGGFAGECAAGLGAQDSFAFCFKPGTSVYRASLLYLPDLGLASHRANRKAKIPSGKIAGLEW